MAYRRPLSGCACRDVGGCCVQVALRLADQTLVGQPLAANRFYHLLMAPAVIFLAIVESEGRLGV
jgi:hypothetical protein